ncbi:hypothetical protein [Paracoccus mutanolyticus]|uniref:hypothetical protein n=1 Tax=Paracoccus mutanolyticus TaxID=1499308 RepID=UPI0011AE7CF1|nr:hypothetical protein [Paracoccus mutanolyticus]
MTISRSESIAISRSSATRRCESSVSGLDHLDPLEPMARTSPAHGNLAEPGTPLTMSIIF